MKEPYTVALMPLLSVLSLHSGLVCLTLLIESLKFLLESCQQFPQPLNSLPFQAQAYLIYGSSAVLYHMETITCNTSLRETTNQQ